MTQDPTLAALSALAREIGSTWVATEAEARVACGGHVKRGKSALRAPVGTRAATSQEEAGSLFA